MRGSSELEARYGNYHGYFKGRVHVPSIGAGSGGAYSTLGKVGKKVEITCIPTMIYHNLPESSYSL